MGENIKEKANVSTNSRRDFLRKAAVVSVGALSVGIGINLIEKNRAENGIDTDSGKFYPLYEHHEVGIAPEKIPSDLDVLFEEGFFAGGFLSIQPKVYLLGRVGKAYFTNNLIEKREFPDEMLEKLSVNGIEIMIGDILPNLKRMTGYLIQSGEFIGGLAMAAKLVRDQFRFKNSTKNTTRRKFIKAMGIIGAAWAIFPGAHFLSRGGPTFNWNKDRDNALDRVADKLYGMQSNLHPEEAFLFFRNLIMADKMLTVAEDIKQKTGRQARIGFQVEYGHMGIEDLLKVGHGFCRTLILSYPDSVIRDAAKINNGIEGLSSARLFKLPRNLFSGESEEKWKQVVDRRVTDVELKKSLELKLG